MKTAQRTLSRTALLLAGAITLSGCAEGGPFGVFETPPPPDEFRVIARKPLSLPPSASLPVPEPGARSPLEPNPQADAIAALLGAGGAATTATAQSEGERQLLAAANTQARDPQIRAALAAEAEAVANDDTYVPPTIVELLEGGGESAVDLRDALDADAEARRLREEGISTAPIDPEETPPSEVPTTRRAAGTFGGSF